jgi:hypothetical protein
MFIASIDPILDKISKFGIGSAAATQELAIKQKRFTVLSFFDWCVAHDVCRRNPALEVQLDRIDRKHRSRFAGLDLAQRLIEMRLTTVFGNFALRVP